METFALLQVALNHMRNIETSAGKTPTELFTRITAARLRGWRSRLIQGICAAAILTCVPFNGFTPALAGILGTGEILQLGSEGANVGAIQRQLNAIGLYNGPISNVYGELTQAAVANYQRSVNLTPDGVFGAQTDRALFDGIFPTVTSQVIPQASDRLYALGQRALRLGDRGQDVRDLQTLLSAQFSPVTPDGVFGPATETTVRNFQRQYNLLDDGIVGASTLTALSNLAALNPSITPLSTSGISSVPITSSLPVPSSNSSVTFGTPIFVTPNDERSPEAAAATLRAAQFNQGPYTVVIPSDSDDEDKLAWVRRTHPQACMASSRRGSYIFAGGYPEYSNAESVRLLLRANRPETNTARTDARVDYRGGEFTVECLY